MENVGTSLMYCSSHHEHENQGWGGPGSTGNNTLCQKDGVDIGVSHAELGIPIEVYTNQVECGTDWTSLPHTLVCTGARARGRPGEAY